MKLPNNYGTIFQLKDKPRRRPWCIRVKGKYIGYAETREKALELLAEYHKDPWDNNEITFKEVFQLWLEHTSPKLSEKTSRTYQNKFKNYCKPLYDKPFKKLRKKDYLKLLDSLDVIDGTKNNLVKFLRSLDRTAYDLDITTRTYTDTLPSYRSYSKPVRKVFSESEINKLWENKDLENVDLVLILLYSGMRSGEFAHLELKNIHLDQDYLIAGEKTNAGKNRYIPIHPRIKDLIKKRIDISDRETLLNFGDKQLRAKFKDVMEHFNMNYVPHECRHTFITRLDNLNADEVCVKLIVGHSSKDVTESVYTHKTTQQLQDTVRLLV